MVDFIIECCAVARTSLFDNFRVLDFVEGAFDKFAPADIVEQCSGRMEVSVTKLLGFQNVRVKRFGSRSELRQAVLASCCIAPLAGWPRWLEGVGWVIDGGYSDLQILKAVLLGRSFVRFHSQEVISVCPFYCSRADIKPTQYVPLWWALFPPKPEDLRRVYELGLSDTLQFLMERSPCPRLPPGEASPATPGSALAALAAGAAANGGGAAVGGGATRPPAWWASTQQQVQVLQQRGSFLVRSCCWTAVYCELLLLSAASAALATAAPFLPSVSAQSAWERLRFCCGSLVKPRLLLSTLPLPTMHCVPRMTKTSPFAHQLRQMCLSFRLLYFLL